MFRQRTAFTLLVLLAFPSLSPRGHDVQGATGSEALDAVIGHIDEAKRRLENVAYTAEFQTINRNAQSRDVDNGMAPARATKGTATLLRSNGRSFSTLSTSATFADGRPDIHSLSRIVENENFGATWNGTDQYAYKYEWTAPESVAPDVAASFAPARGMNPIRYALGSWSLTLPDLRKNNPDPRQWSMREATGPDGDGGFEVEFSREIDGKLRRVAQYFVDPNRGFLVTHARTFDDDGTPAEEMRTTVRRVEGTSTWVPVSVTHTARDREFTATLKDVRLDPPAKASDFSLEALGFPENTRLVTRDLSGKSRIDGYVDGHFVPVYFLNEQKRQESNLRRKVAEQLDSSSPADALSAGTPPAAQGVAPAAGSPAPVGTVVASDTGSRTAAGRLTALLAVVSGACAALVGVLVYRQRAARKEPAP